MTVCHFHVCDLEQTQAVSRLDGQSLNLEVYMEFKTLYVWLNMAQVSHDSFLFESASLQRDLRFKETPLDAESGAFKCA